MFEFIKIEDIKSLCTHVVENFATTLDKITYVQVTSRSRLRIPDIEQHSTLLRFCNPPISDVQGVEDALRSTPG